MSAQVSFDKVFAPAEAERGKFAPINMSTLSPEYSGRGRYAVLTYQLNASPINLSGDVEVTTNIPNTSLYETITVSAESVETKNFSTPVTLVEIYNSSDTNTIYAGFNVSMNVSAEGLPLSPETFYSIERETSNVYVANPSDTAIDVRIIGHYKI
jgi:hypothetical protein